MRIFVAGASGVIGRQLVPLLESAGHTVIGMARTVRGEMGSTTVAADAMDRDAVFRAVEQSEPDAIVNMLTAIPDRINPKRIDQDFAATNELRVHGTTNLLYAAQRAGVSHFISQSIAFGYEPRQSVLADEKAALWHDPPKPFATIMEGVKRLESITLAGHGTVLRFGHLYGPETGFTYDGWFFKEVQRGKMPMVGDGTATFSFLHTYDAASAIVAALSTKQSGIFNIVDNEPTQVREWLPELARMLGAPAPKRLPVLLAGLAMGSWGVAYMTRLRGADNTRAKTELNWHPTYASWRDGFVTQLAA